MNEILLIQLVKGDKSAFEKIYSKYYYKVYSIAKMYVGYTEDAQEVVQDVFVRLWKTREQVNVKSNFDGYMFTLTKNIIYDRFRKDKSLQMMKMAYVRIIDQHSNNLQEDILAKELLKKVNDFVETLPPRQKEVFLLSRKMGLTRKEIAEKLNMNVNAVDRNINIVLSKLKKVIFFYIAGFILLFL